MLKIGHRGACGLEPENTMRSFSRAVELECDMIEFDVHLCKTGEIVVIHDRSVKRVSGKSGLVSKLSFKELRALDVGMGEKIPTLGEVIHGVKEVDLNIELKGPGTGKAVAVELLKFRSDWKRIIVSSFVYQELVDFHQDLPQVRVGVLYRSMLGWLGKARGVKAYSVHFGLGQTVRRRVWKAQKEGLKVFSFTANIPQEWNRLVRLGVDGAKTNFPDRF